MLSYGASTCGRYCDGATARVLTLTPLSLLSLLLLLLVSSEGNVNIFNNLASRALDNAASPRGCPESLLLPLGLGPPPPALLRLPVTVTESASRDGGEEDDDAADDDKGPDLSLIRLPAAAEAEVTGSISRSRCSGKAGNESAPLSDVSLSMSS